MRSWCSRWSRCRCSARGGCRCNRGRRCSGGVAVGVAVGVPDGAGVGVPAAPQRLVNSMSSTHQPAPGTRTPLSRPSRQRTRTPLPANAPRFTSTRSMLGADVEVPVHAGWPAIGLSNSDEITPLYPPEMKDSPPHVHPNGAAVGAHLQNATIEPVLGNEFVPENKVTG